MSVLLCVFVEPLLDALTLWEIFPRIPDLSFLYLSTGVSADVLADSRSLYSQPLMGGNVDGVGETTVLTASFFFLGRKAVGFWVILRKFHCSTLWLCSLFYEREWG